MKKYCSGLAAFAAVLLMSTGLAHAAPILQSQSPCVPSPPFGSCMDFPAAGTVFSIRTLDFNAPSAGQALVSVNGSGFGVFRPTATTRRGLAGRRSRAPTATSSMSPMGS